MNKVLLVEDDEDLLSMVTLMLESHQFEVKALSTGKDFLITVIKEKPDMIVMDIFLDGVDGRKLCKELKSTSALTRIPVILYSASNIPADSIQQSSADDFLHKPFDIFELLKRIRLKLDARTD